MPRAFSRAVRLRREWIKACGNKASREKYAGSVSGVKFSPGSGANLVVDGGMTRNIDAGICVMDLLCFCIFAGNNRGE
ncbi:hypothetical protein [Desulfofundulus salinus]|uniref:Uncharacterized protein n=1 Tax=Desulfofundulus salinus TaxID=2419843 RepID=A0A494WW93_9FIRM|nr:hypothetical protein [Desulfofundulus salinum]RKO67796.1 hypothetical protein D7024_13125 [Desulfofundulus salinum]